MARLSRLCLAKTDGGRFLSKPCPFSVNWLKFQSLPGQGGVFLTISFYPMTKFELLEGKTRIFGTDDETVFRNFLRHPGANQPMLVQETRSRITALLAQLPEVLPEQLSIEERTGAYHTRLRIVIGHVAWKGPGS